MVIGAGTPRLRAGAFSPGIALMVAGLAILLAVALVWLLAPLASPLAQVQTAAKEKPAVAALKPAPLLITPPPALPAWSPPAPLLLAPAVSAPDMAPAAEPEQIAPDPWPPAEPVRLAIPALGIDTAVQAVGLAKERRGEQRYRQWQVPASYAAGWHRDSALLGQPGNTVLNGHNNIHGQVFGRLAELAIGQQIVLYDSEDRPRVYEVTQRELLSERGQPLEVRQENARWIMPSEDERVTLVTCWPNTSNSHRLVLVAHPVPDSPS